jgi:hypothetical protein
MNEKLEYTKSEKISLRRFYNEKWLQERIEEDSSIIGLGELTILSRERKQSSGGRIDFLCLNAETNTMYEIEIMLGPTDESHIIRTIEYWDIESRRFPSKDHRAVIIAEEITNRFFNVISLMNRSVPIIAIQLNALRVEEKILLSFTTVLDIYEFPDDIDELGSESVDRNYWEKKSNPKSISTMDDIITLLNQTTPNVKVTYNKYHIAVGTTRRNFIWFYPRKKENYLHLEIKTGKDNLESIKATLEEIGISFNPRNDDILSLMIQKADIKQHGQKLTEILNLAKSTFK